jgi:hypothetical protein
VQSDLLLDALTSAPDDEDKDTWVAIRRC